MPRKSKPWKNNRNGKWYTKHDGRMVYLGEDKAEATKEFHRLKLDASSSVPANLEDPIVVEIFGRFSEWLQHNRTQKTYSWYLGALQPFARHIGATMRISEIKVHHVHSWVDSHPDWAPDTKRGRMSAIQRAFRWAWENEIINSLPFRRLEKPAPRQREVTIDDVDWHRVLDETDDTFRPLLLIARATGCRPQEVRIIEAHHVVSDGQMIVLERWASKGKKRQRVLYLPESIRPLVADLCQRYPVGPILRNRRGEPWTANTVHCRMRRLKIKLGIKHLFAYAIRHTWVNAALLKLPVQKVAELAGHDATTAMRSYGHLGQETAAMLEAADEAIA